MAILAQNSSERLRTIWTPEMDRYFIELMLDQVEKGNRIDDSLFSKRAWKHMTSLFNSKFKFQYEKDVLKNRHKTLRNLYKAAKNLLEQKGFSWDETRQMVKADNNIWDAYVKVHPDARSYRIKTIPYYSDLCSIYRNTNAETKGKDLSNGANSDINKAEKIESEFCDNMRLDGESNMVALHEIMIDEDYCISLTTGDGVDKQLQALPNEAASSINNRSRTYWQPPMDRYFIDLMLEQVQKGNRVDAVFRKQAWVEMIASFNAKFGFNYDMDILKNRYKTFKRQYNVISNLLELNGFVWDDTRLMVTADDYVWQDYIKTHTNARQFMTRPVPYYKELCVICKDPSIDDIDFISCQNPDTIVLENDDQPEDMDDQSHLIMENGATTRLRNKRQSENQSNSTHLKKAHVQDGYLSNAVNEIDSDLPSLSDTKRDDEDSSSISIENVIGAVQALPEMDEELILDACDLLEDEKKAKTFLALDVKLRKKWLIRKLRPQPL